MSDWLQRIVSGNDSLHLIALCAKEHAEERLTRIPNNGRRTPGRR